MREILIHGRMRKLGWLESPPDHRDLMYGARPGILPPRMDLRRFCSPVDDQGATNSCTAHATTAALEYLWARMRLQKSPDFSRLFVYWVARALMMEGDPAVDGGAVIREVVKGLRKYGVCYEATWPFDTTRIAERPPMPAFQEAELHQVVAYERHDGFASNLGVTLDSVKRAIFDGYPVVGGFRVPQSSVDPQVGVTGVIPMPKPDEGFLGGHAVLFVGYDDATEHLIFKNSWGTGWGNGGYGYLPYAFFRAGLVRDLWSLRSQEG
jgi:C1A family cysteine protease